MAFKLITLSTEEIKKRISIESVLSHYGSKEDSKGRFHCPFPENTIMETLTLAVR